jgi:hypothetical protein
MDPQDSAYLVVHSNGGRPIQRARRYLDTAVLVLEEGDFESCVSRAYYAMFYVARALLRQEDVTPSTHQGLVNQFGLHFVKTERLPARFGRMFREVKELRELAEYAEERVITREDAEATLRDANAFVDRVSEMLRDT